MTVIDRPLRRSDRKRATDRRPEWWPLSSDADLWDQIDHRELDALTEAFRRHGQAAYAVALAITADPELAQHAVTTTFGRLFADARGIALDTLRLAILAAVRRSAGQLAEGRSPSDRTGDARLGTVLGGLAPDVRDVLALAIAGRCGSADIVAITGYDRATVHRHMRVGLHHVGAALDRGAKGHS